MRLEAWRVAKPRYAASAFDGEGAARAPGRWNRAGQRAVYAADSPSLALLEIMAHASYGLARLYRLIPCSFDEGLVEELDPRLLPAGWRRLLDPAWAPLQELGGAWLASGRSAVLRVPTVLVPRQSNYLLNPLHPDFRLVEIGEAQDLEPDPRLSPGPRAEAGPALPPRGPRGGAPEPAAKA